MVYGPAYIRDNSALPYRSAQTRLFGVHKEQQGASREKYAPVVRTAARARGRGTHLSTSALFGVQIRTLFDAFSVWRVLRKNEPELSAPVVRVYCRRWCMVRRIFATIRRCRTVAPKHDFSGSTRNNRPLERRLSAVEPVRSTKHRRPLRYRTLYTRLNAASWSICVQLQHPKMLGQKNIC